MKNRIIMVLVCIMSFFNLYAQENQKCTVKIGDNVVFVRADTLYGNFLQKTLDGGLKGKNAEFAPFQSIWYEQILQIWRNHITTAQNEESEKLKWMFNVVFKLGHEGNILNFELELNPKIYDILLKEQLESFFQSCLKMKLPPFYIEKENSDKYYYHLKLPFNKRWLKLLPRLKENEKLLKENFKYESFILVK